jgi:hypothetical protein
METKSFELSEKTILALKRILMGVQDQRKEAFILLTALPEACLSNVVDYLRLLTGLTEGVNSEAPRIKMRGRRSLSLFIETYCTHTVEILPSCYSFRLDS